MRYELLFELELAADRRAAQSSLAELQQRLVDVIVSSMMGEVRAGIL